MGFSGYRRSKWSIEEHELEREIKEQRDFRERAAQEAERQAQQEERLRQDEASAQRQQSEWRDRWMEYVLERTPRDAPPEVRMEIPRRVDEALSRFQATSPKKLIKRMLDDMLDGALRPWRQEEERRELSNAARNISAADLYAQVHRKLGFDKLARQLETRRFGKKPKLTRSTLGGYAQILCGETPRRRIKATTLDKINEEMRGIALDLAIEDRSFARELLRLTRR